MSCVSFPSSFCRACYQEHLRRWRRLRVLRLSRADLRRACVQQKLRQLHREESILVPDRLLGPELQELHHTGLGPGGERAPRTDHNGLAEPRNLAAAADTGNGRGSHHGAQLDAGRNPLEVGGTHHHVEVGARRKANGPAGDTDSVQEGKDFAAVHIDHVRNPAEAARRTGHDHSLEAVGSSRSPVGPVGSNPGPTWQSPGT